MEDPSNTSIYEAHNACVNAFARLLEAVTSLPPDQHAWSERAILNAFDKYKVWAGNLGAIHSGRQWRKSLDYRLREASFYKVQVLRLLKSLKNAVERGTTINNAKNVDDTDSDILSDTIPSEEDSPWEVSSDSEDGQTIERQGYGSAPSRSHASDSASVPVASDFRPSAILNLVNHIITCLWKLPVRRPAPLDRIKETSTVDTSYYQPFDVQHVKNKFPMANELVASRLGKMISRRRQLLRYRETHMDSLSKSRDVTRRQVVDAKFDEEVVDIQNIESAPSHAESTHRTYSTHATTLKLDVKDRPPTTWNLDAPSVTMTVSSDGLEREDDSPIIIPKRPKGDDGATLEQFVCPYCHTMQTIRTDRSWRKHILQDLQPYVCTYAECALGEYVFQDQEEWYLHEAQNHRYHWFCNVGGHDTFESAENFIEHMKSSHQQNLGKHELHALQHTFRRPANTQAGVCPLCFETTQKIKPHLARHLKQLALFAIPQTDFMTLSDVDDEGASERAYRSDQTVSSPRRSSQASKTYNRSSGRSSKTAASKAGQLPEEDSHPLVFYDTEGSSLPSGTTHDTSWDYATSKFRDARKREQGTIPNQEPTQDHPVPEVNLIQSPPPSSEAESTGASPLSDNVLQEFSRDDTPSNYIEIHATSTPEKELIPDAVSQESIQQMHPHSPTVPESRTPVLNLVDSTPPRSMTDEMEAVLRPSSPPPEPVQNKMIDGIRRGSHVSWGENQHHVVTPDPMDSIVPEHSQGTKKDDNKPLDSPSVTETARKLQDMSGITSTGDDGVKPVRNPYYQQRPICGASIGAFYGGEHLPPVSLGGIILVDGEPYGLTVHHILDAPSDDESEAEDDKSRSGVEPNARQSSTSANSPLEQPSNTEPSTSGKVSNTNPWVQGITDPSYLSSSNDSVALSQDQSSMEQKDFVPSQSQQPAEYHMSNQVVEAGSEASQSASNRPTHYDTVPLWDLELSDEDGFESEGVISTDSLSNDENREEREEDLSGTYERGLTFPGDIPGISPGEGKDIIITQPAIDDVDDSVFANRDYPESDHLEMHTLGHIYASSGIRRVKRNGVLHEVDWALIKINPQRLQMYNVVEGGRRFSIDLEPHDPPPLADPITRRHYQLHEDEYPMEVAPADRLGGMNVHCFGRTTGLQGGMISPAMTQVRLYSRTSFSRSWFVAGGFGVGGDAGAWVVQNNTGQVCGVVLAWDERNKVAFIMPMEIILDDIKHTLRAETVCLPSRKNMTVKEQVEREIDT